MRLNDLWATARLQVDYDSRMGKTGRKLDANWISPRPMFETIVRSFVARRAAKKKKEAAPKDGPRLYSHSIQALPYAFAGRPLWPAL